MSHYMSPLTLVVAVARGLAIGSGGRLPWQIPEDLRRFRRTTIGHPVIMGRKTWDSLGEALPDRINIVVSRQRHLVLQGALVVPSFRDALAIARLTCPEPCVIGGSGIYAAAWPHVTRIELTEIDRDVEADTFFPIVRDEWRAFRETSRRSAETPGVTFSTWERAQNG